MMIFTLPEINPGVPLLGDGQDLTSGLSWWYLAYPAIMAGTKWVNLGDVKGVDGVGTLVNMAYPPTNLVGWTVRHGMHPGGRGALALNNSTARLIFNGSANLLGVSSPFTMSWWERIHDTSQTFPARAQLVFDSGGSPAIWMCTRTNTTSTALSWGPGGGTASIGAAVGTVSTEAGKWNHMTVVCLTNPASTTAADWIVYKNGATITPTAVASGIGTPAGDNRFGRSGSNQQVNSSLNDIAIWPARALTASEARNWYHSSLNGHAGFLQTLPGVVFAPTTAAGDATPMCWASYRPRRS